MKYLILLLFFICSLRTYSCNDTTWKVVDLRGLTPSTNKGLHQIRFVKIDTISSRQRWTYQVKTNSKYSISHLVFNILPCVSVYSISSNNQIVYNPINQLQPPTYVSGIKADWAIPANKIVTIQIITQNFYLPESRSVYLKSGQVENFTNICQPSCMTYLDLTNVDIKVVLDKVYFKFTKNRDDLVNIYEVNEYSGKLTWILTTSEMMFTLNHTSRYYLITSNNYHHYFGPYQLTSYDPRRTLSVKQLLGQIVD